MDYTTFHLQHEKIDPRSFQAYKNLRLENSNTDGYIILNMGYGRSLFQNFESYLRIVVDLDEADIQKIFKENNSVFVKSEIPPGSC